MTTTYREREWLQKPVTIAIQSLKLPACKNPSAYLRDSTTSCFSVLPKSEIGILREPMYATPFWAVCTPNLSGGHDSRDEAFRHFAPPEANCLNVSFTHRYRIIHTLYLYSISISMVLPNYLHAIICHFFRIRLASSCVCLNMFMSW